MIEAHGASIRVFFSKAARVWQNAPCLQCESAGGSSGHLVASLEMGWCRAQVHQPQTGNSVLVPFNAAYFRMVPPAQTRHIVLKCSEQSGLDVAKAGEG